MERVVSWQGEEIRYIYQRKKVKNINIRVKPDGSVRVSAGYGVSAKDVDQIVLKRAPWIVQAMERIRQTVPESVPELFYRDGEQVLLLGRCLNLEVHEAKENCFQICGDKIILSVENTEDIDLRKNVFLRGHEQFTHYELKAAVTRMEPLFHGYEILTPVVRIRRMRSRWGSCTPGRGSITMNYYLIQAPVACIDYVAAHELAHLVVPNHSSAFYNVLAEVMPDYRERKTLLNQLGIVCAG